jgi:uncharacterized protein involved in cysteine biosynthesis
MIFSDFGRAISQIADPRFRRVFLLGIGLTFAMLVAIYAAFLLLLSSLFGNEIILPLVGEVRWLNDLLSWSSFFVMVGFSMFLMVPVASAITSLFLEDVAQAVEDKHYPHLPEVPRWGIWQGIRDSINFLGVIVAANLLALVLYAFFPPFIPLIFWGLNGYLLGREYFQLVAMRREGLAGAKRLRREYILKIWVAGVLMAIPLSIPLLNLVIPILGVATFTHFYHRVAGR